MRLLARFALLRLSLPTSRALDNPIPLCLQVAIIVKGVESIRVVEGVAAPILTGLALALLAWALHSAGGFGPMLSSPSQVRRAADRIRWFVVGWLLLFIYSTNQYKQHSTVCAAQDSK